MSWTFQPAFDAGHRAALSSGSSLVYVGPPASWAVRPLLERLPASGPTGLTTLLLAPGASEADEIAAEARAIETLAPVHAAAGVARASRLLEAGVVRTLAVSPATTLRLMERSALKLDTLDRLVMLWPEWYAGTGQSESLDAVLADAGGAPRIVVTADVDAVTDLLERHAHRAPVLRATARPEEPTGRLRAATVEPGRRRWAADAVLEALDPATAFVWDPSVHATTRWADRAWDPTVTVGAEIGDQPVDLAIAAELPSTEAWAALSAVAGETVVFCQPAQLPALETMAAAVVPYRLPGEADRAAEWVAEIQRRVRGRVAQGGLEPSLVALGPLLEEYDPAVLAAALLTDRTETAPTAPATLGASATVPTWAHVRLSVGRRDRLRPGDVVGALLNAVGLTKTQIGRVDVRDSFSVVEIRAEAADRAREGLDNITLRGARVSARFDRR